MASLAETVTDDIPEPKGLSAKHREWIAGYLFVLPDALGLFIFLGVPMLLSLVLSVYEVDGFGGYTFVGAKNYIRMWNDPLFWKGARVTAAYAAMLVPSLYVCGLGLALLVQQTNRFNAVMRSMFFAPHMVSLVVVALIWQFMVIDKIGVVRTGNDRIEEVTLRRTMGGFNSDHDAKQVAVRVSGCAS